MTLTEDTTFKRFNKLWIVCLKVLFLRDGQLATTTKCQLCILCQKQTEENLVCPLENPVASRREGAYTDIIGLVSQCNTRDSNSGLPRQSPISYHQTKGTSLWIKGDIALLRPSGWAVRHSCYTHPPFDLLPQGNPIPLLTPL